MAREVFWCGFNIQTDGSLSPRMLWRDEDMTDQAKNEKWPITLVRLEIDRKTGGVSATLERTE